jgi:hypothetical protein
VLIRHVVPSSLLTSKTSIAYRVLRFGNSICPALEIEINVQGVVLSRPTRFGRSTRILLTLGIATAVIAGLFVFSPASFAQSGAQTAPANLDDLTQQAATILRGSVVSAAIEPHPQFSNVQTVTVTISVARVLKGESSKIFTFRQFVWDPRDAAAAAGYRKGGELLLFLNPNSQYGLTSPVGLDQGRFRVLRDASGKAFAVNGRANFALFNQVLGKASSRGLQFSRQAAAMMTAPHGKVPLESFEDAVITLARAGK